jgi:hypothetical protein
MCAYHSGVGLWFVIAVVVDDWGQPTRASGPVVVRDEVEVLIESRLGLLMYDTKYLGNCGAP